MTEPRAGRASPAARMDADRDEHARGVALLAVAHAKDRGPRSPLSGPRDALAQLGDLQAYLRENALALVIGSGIGRSLQFLAVLFDEVHGCDVSAPRVAPGCHYLEPCSNAHFAVGDGARHSMDACASFELQNARSQAREAACVGARVPA